MQSVDCFIETNDSTVLRIKSGEFEHAAIKQAMCVLSLWMDRSFSNHNSTEEIVHHFCLTCVGATHLFSTLKEFIQKKLTWYNRAVFWSERNKLRWTLQRMVMPCSPVFHLSQLLLRCAFFVYFLLWIFMVLMAWSHREWRSRQRW